ncbi:MAG TPA: threonine synthase [Actinomycetota bacterium]|nr:threonine synthase [Actinomycetota bacterium]
MPSRLSHLECARCARAYDPERLVNRCDCGGTLLARYDLDGIDLERCRARPPDAWRFRELLPVRGAPVSLGEPRTALLPVPRLAGRWGVDALVKDDGTLPGGTFKARGACVGLSRAHELGATSVVMPSAGNAGGAWSLYAARANVRITVTMARSAPAANHTEVLVAGGELELVDGTIADAGARAVDIARERGSFLTATFAEPYRLEGKKAAWLEVFDQLGDDDGMRLPGTVVLPVGGGVAALALAKAAEEVRALGWTGDPAPAIVGVQPAACAPVVRAFERGDDAVEPWDGPCDSIAAGLRVPAPSEGAFVLRVVRASGGAMVAVSEDDIRAAVRDLATFEGVFACPEGAAGVAALDELARSRPLREPVVVYNTGAGAKYVDVLS